MVVKVNFLLFLAEVLDELSGRQVVLQILNIVLHNFGLVRDRKVKKVIAQSKLKSLKFI